MAEGEPQLNALDNLPEDIAVPESQDIPNPWPAPKPQGPAESMLTLPGSKSLTNRELLLAAISDQAAVIRKPLFSRDSDLMIDALKQFGVGFTEIAGSGQYGPDLMVFPAKEFSGDFTVDCGLAGTVMRFIPPLAAFNTGSAHFTGDEAALRRPMDGVTQGLRELGVNFEPADAKTLPITVHGKGKLSGGTIKIDASASSQFVSALLLIGPLTKKGITIIHTGERLPSIPHIEMTIKSLRDRGIEVSSPETGVWRVEPGTVAGINLTIEPDLSNAAPFLASAIITGGKVGISDWPEETTQVGRMLKPYLEMYGATFERIGDSLVVDGGLGFNNGGTIPGLDLDFSAAGELSPTFAGLAAFADGPSRLTGIGHLRGHETDRLEALKTELTKIGAEVTIEEDGLYIVPGDLKPSVWDSYDDHRIATTGALVGLGIAGMQVDNVGTTAKTLPQFVDIWTKLTER